MRRFALRRRPMAVISRYLSMLTSSLPTSRLSAFKLLHKTRYIRLALFALDA